MITLLRLLIISLPIFLIGLIVAFFSFIYRLNVWTRAYDELARRYHGVSMVRRFRPCLKFPYFGATCTLGTQRRGQYSALRRTFVRLPWTDRKLILEVASRKFGSTLAGRGLTDQATGEPDFDSTYRIRCNRPEAAEAWLDDNVRWRIRELARLCGSAPLRLLIDRGSLTIAREGYLSGFQELDDFLRMSLQLIDQLKVTQITGIDFINEDQATLLDEVHCPVCSEQVSHEMVICVRCKTPHCRECWEYNTHCATFACGETRYFSAQGSVPHAAPPRKAR